MGRPDGSEGYEIEFEFPYGTTIDEFEDARKKGIDAIRGWLGQKAPAPTQRAPQPEPLDPEVLDRLPWRPYKEGHRAAWIFTNTPDAENLAEAIRHSETGQIKAGEFVYDFSGRKDEDPTMFIRRTPIEETKKP